MSGERAKLSTSQGFVKDNGDSDTKVGVAAVDRALSILAAFDDGTQQLDLAELARRTGLYKSTLLRLAASLENGGVLRRGADGAFRLGPTLFRLGTLYRDSFDLRDLAMPVMQHLADVTGESVSFYAREGDKRICLFRVHATQHRILHYLRPGTVFPANTGAAGKVLTAWSEPFAEKAAAMRDQVLMLSIAGRTIADTNAMSVPVLDAEGGLVGAMSLAGPALRFGEAERPVLAAALLEAGAELTRLLGGDSTPHAYRLANLDEVLGRP